MPELKTYTAHRISSYDTTGGNRDALFIPAGKTVTLARIPGPGCITHIWCTIAAEPFYAKKIVLRMYWDGETDPSVEAPIGDFFGVGHGLDRNYTSLPFTVTSHGRARNCFFPMPFRKSAKIEVTNEGSEPVQAFYYYIDYRTYKALDEDVAYFHAQYRQEMPCQPGKNYLFLEAEGQGHYVGVSLSILNRAPGWWGEGDDMIYVDGEQKPSFHGTGSEDYFCDAWGMRESQSLFYGCPLQEEGYDIGDKATVYRFHIADPIPFKKSLKVTIEHGHANDRADDFSSVAYWYQKEPHKKFATMPPVSERLPFAFDLPEEALAVASLLPPTATSGKGFKVDSLAYYTPTGAKLSQVLFPFDAVGDSVSFNVPIKTAEKYLLQAYFVQAPNRGKIQLRINGKTLPIIFDGYAPETKLVGPVEFGEVIVTQKNVPLTLTVVGKNKESSGFGLGICNLCLLPKREFVIDWYVMGPFDNPRGASDTEGLGLEYPPEREINLKKTYKGKDGILINWQRVKADEGGYVNLDHLITPNEYTVAYGLTYVYSPEPKEVSILLGSDDGVRLWINDQLVHDHLVKRGAAPDQDRVPVTLVKGWNKILIKVEEAGGAWGFYFRVPDPEGKLKFSPSK
ncbi:MAG: DUF2961 domain-containing protein [candidate division KSB1 bacterium]|nr:DUF2961 domain-containing protein [candidate division KSB1 bacterium]